MKNKLPIYIENKNLPTNPYKKEDKESYYNIIQKYIWFFNKNLL